MPCTKNATLINPGVVYMVAVEGLTTLGSLYAAYLHSRATGMPIKFRGASPTSFHLAHALFCSMFVITFGGALVRRTSCLCDPFNVMFVLLYLSMTITFGLFTRFWMKTVAEEPVRRGVFRMILYGVTFLGLASFYLANVFHKPCLRRKTTSYDIFTIFITILQVLFIVDTSILAMYCFSKWRELRGLRAPAARKWRLGPADIQVILFISLPISLTAAMVVFAFSGTYFREVKYLSHFFEFLVPAAITLFIMWKRNYIGATRHDGDDEITWTSNTASRLTIELRNETSSFTALTEKELMDLEKTGNDQLFAFDQDNYHGTGRGKKLDLSGGLLQSVVKELREGLVRVPPRTSRVEIVDAFVLGRAPPPPPLPPPPLSDGMALPPPLPIMPPLAPEGAPAASTGSGFSLVVEEHLEPSVTLSVVANTFLAKIVLPKVERIALMSLDRIKVLVDELKPASRSSDIDLGDLELERQFEKCRKLGQDTQDQLTDQVQVLKATVLAKNAAGYGAQTSGKKVKKAKRDAVIMEATSVASASADDSDMLIFKPSTQKKSLAMAFLSTNCQLHTTSLHAEGGPSGGEVPDGETVVSVTFGAPSAHALGFKNGGLRALKAKVMSAIKEPDQQWTGTATKSMGTLLGKMTQDAAEAGDLSAEITSMLLEFEWHVRESVVMCQALGAVVAAGVDLLTRTVRERKATVIRQLFTVGMLVHSVCLLSTTGTEESMLDDFAGAYESLKAVFRLEGPGAPGSPPQDVVKQGEDVRDPDGSGLGITVVSVESGKAESGGSGAGNVVVVLRVESAASFEWLCTGALKLARGSKPTPIRVRPTLFNLGAWACSFKEPTPPEAQLTFCSLPDLPAFSSQA